MVDGGDASDTSVPDADGGCVPTTEMCNGVDDDCNALVDDLPGRGDACTNVNGFGVCDGIMDCKVGFTDQLTPGSVSELVKDSAIASNSPIIGKIAA